MTNWVTMTPVSAMRVDRCDYCGRRGQIYATMAGDVALEPVPGHARGGRNIVAGTSIAATEAGTTVYGAII